MYILRWNINLLPLVELKILPWIKILILKVWPKSEVSGPWNISHGSCIFLLVSQRYILIWNTNLLTVIGLEILPWTKKLTWSTEGRTDVRTTRTLYVPGGPRPRGHNNYLSFSSADYWYGLKIQYTHCIDFFSSINPNTKRDIWTISYLIKLIVYCLTVLYI